MIESRAHGRLRIKLASLPLANAAYNTHERGVRAGEPVTVAMDALYRYAERHRDEYHGLIADDGVLGEPWLQAIKGIRRLLDGTGSFDGGTLEDLFWEALAVAGFTEDDL